jgi:hypothetical protein
MKAKQILVVYQGSIEKVLGKSWDEAVAALPRSLRDALPGERPAWGAFWYVKGKNGELEHYQDNADSSD